MYDPRHPRAIDLIRFVLADTDDTKEFLPDGTYAQLLSHYSDDKVATARAAAATIEGIIRRIPVTRSANGESVSYAGQAEFYRRIATGETPLPLLEEPDAPEPTPAPRQPFLSAGVATEATW